MNMLIVVPCLLVISVAWAVAIVGSVLRCQVLGHRLRWVPNAGPGVMSTTWACDRCDYAEVRSVSVSHQ